MLSHVTVLPTGQCDTFSVSTSTFFISQQEIPVNTLKVTCSVCGQRNLISPSDWACGNSWEEKRCWSPLLHEGRVAVKAPNKSVIVSFSSVRFLASVHVSSKDCKQEQNTECVPSIKLDSKSRVEAIITQDRASHCIHATHYQCAV